MSIDPEKQEVGVWTVITACSRETKRTARIWLYYTLFYWMFPTVAIVFGLLVTKHTVKWLDLVIHGEFLIYAITIVAGSTRLIAKDLQNRPPFVNRQSFNLISHIMVFPAIFIYGLVRYVGVTSNPSDVSAGIVVTYSVILLVLSFIFSYVVFLIDAQRSTPYELPQRVVTAIAQAPNRLNFQFNELQREDPAAPPAVAPIDDEPEEVEEEPAVAEDAAAAAAPVPPVVEPAPPEAHEPEEEE